MKDFIRVLGLVLALFLITSSVADIVGIVPHSKQMPAVVLRIRQSFVPMIAAILLLIGWKNVRRGPAMFVYLTGLLAVCLWYTALGIRRVAGFIAGHRVSP